MIVRRTNIRQQFEDIIVKHVASHLMPSTAGMRNEKFRKFRYCARAHAYIHAKFSNFTYFIYLKKGTKYNTFFYGCFRTISESAFTILGDVAFRSNCDLIWLYQWGPENRRTLYSRSQIPPDYTLLLGDHLRAVAAS